MIVKEVYDLCMKLEVVPKSIKKSIFNYDINALYESLRLQEEKDLLTNVEQRKMALVLSTKYGDLVDKINEKSLDFSLIYKTMDYLDAEIENALYGNYKLYAIQWGLSVKALWFYRNNDFDQAIKITEECIAIIDEFIMNGMYCMVFRNIELNKNLALVYNKKTGVQSGYKIICNIINYYFFSTNDHLYGLCFKNEEVREEMPYLRETMGYIFFREQVERYYSLLKSDLDMQIKNPV